jgi:hypothetical protein
MKLQHEVYLAAIDARAVEAKAEARYEAIEEFIRSLRLSGSWQMRMMMNDRLVGPHVCHKNHTWVIILHAGFFR